MKFLKKHEETEEEHVKDWILSALMYLTYEAGGSIEIPIDEANLVGEQLGLSLKVADGFLIVKTATLGAQSDMIQ